MLVHTHLEKCGGSTLLHYLTRLIGKEYTLDLRSYLGKKSFQGYQEIQKRKHNLRLLSGHFRYNSHWAKFIPNNQWSNKIISPFLNPFGRKKALYIASARHPIDRLDSLFRYLKTRPRHYLYNQHIANNDFDGFIQMLVAKENQFVNNGMCAQIAKCAPGQNIFEKAKKSFNDNYLAIIPYDKTHELANMFADVFQLPMVTEKIVNKSEPSHKPIPSKETLHLLEENCADDVRFYQYVVDHYQTKLVAAKNHLQNLITK